MSSSMIMLMVLAVVSPSEANTFLRTSPERVSTKLLEQSFFQEYSGALGQARPGRLNEIEKSMQSTWSALPKNKFGNLEYAAVRYALHRFFVQRHGWFIKGLESGGGAWNSSSPAGVLKDRVPEYIHGLFEQRLDGHGFGLHELAVFVATLEDLVHGEAVSRLEAAYVKSDFVESSLQGSEEELDDVIDTYLMGYILSTNVSALSSQEVRSRKQRMPRQYPGWSDTVSWSRDVRSTVQFKERDVANPFVVADSGFSTAASVVEEMGERFGRWQDIECRSLKDALLDIEHLSSGRVLLSDFYKKKFNGEQMFLESKDYLRELGALDETDQRRPSVIIPNYVGGQSNCLASSSFYTVCCLDQCEPLLAKLEREIATPTALPREIAELVAHMASDTVDAPRNLSSVDLQRLYEIATQNDGRVPLHGRLFAQWMHHVFPRECPYPHVTGTTNPRTPDEWMAENNGASFYASREEITNATKKNILIASPSQTGTSETALPWNAVEELLVARPTEYPAPVKWWSSLRGVALVAVLGSMAALLVGASKPVLENAMVQKNKLEKYIV